MSGADEKGARGSVYDDHLRQWLRAGLTGCHFASSVASQARINYLDQLNELVPADVATINKHIDTAGAEEFFAVVLFPRVRTPREIVRLLETLCTDDRWSAKRVPWKKHSRSGVTPVGIEYTASSGERSASVMGLAPLGCMPITRRAPYVALAVYGGPKATSYKRTEEGELGLIDARALDAADQELTDVAHQKLWDQTMDRVKALSQDPPEAHYWMRHVAFFLADALVADWLPVG